MKVLEGFRHLSFDLWLTLIKSDPAFKPMRDELFARHFGLKPQLDKVSAAFRHFDLLFNRINEQAGGNVQTIEMLYVILDHLGVQAGTVPATALEAFYDEMELLFMAYPPVLLERDTLRAFDRIKAHGCSISLLSNTGFIRGRSLRLLLENLGIAARLDFQLYSDELGYSKPSHRAYASVLEESNKRRTLEKQHILHIGDNPVADLEGARRYGFASLIFNQENNLRKLFLN